MSYFWSVAKPSLSEVGKRIRNFNIDVIDLTDQTHEIMPINEEVSRKNQKIEYWQAPELLTTDHIRRRKFRPGDTDLNISSIHSKDGMNISKKKNHLDESE